MVKNTEDICNFTIIYKSEVIDLKTPLFITLNELLVFIFKKLQHSEEKIDNIDNADYTNFDDWILQTVDKKPIDKTQKIQETNIINGDVLYLIHSPRHNNNIVFDDLAEGISIYIRKITTQWTYIASTIAFKTIILLVVILINLFIYNNNFIHPILKVVELISISHILLLTGLLNKKNIFQKYITFCCYIIPALLSSVLIGLLLQGILHSHTLLPIFFSTLEIGFITIFFISDIGFFLLFLSTIMILINILNITYNSYTEIFAITLIINYITLPRMPHISLIMSKFNLPYIPTSSQDIDVNIEPISSNKLEKGTISVYQYINIFLLTNLLLTLIVIALFSHDHNDNIKQLTAIFIAIKTIIHSKNYKELSRKIYILGTGVLSLFIIMYNNKQFLYNIFQNVSSLSLIIIFVGILSLSHQFMRSINNNKKFIYLDHISDWIHIILAWLIPVMIFYSLHLFSSIDKLISSYF